MLFVPRVQLGVPSRFLDTSGFTEGRVVCATTHTTAPHACMSPSWTREAGKTHLVPTLRAAYSSRLAMQAARHGCSCMAPFLESTALLADTGRSVRTHTQGTFRCVLGSTVWELHARAHSTETVKAQTPRRVWAQRSFSAPTQGRERQRPPDHGSPRREHARRGTWRPS